MLTLPSILQRTRLQFGRRCAIRAADGEILWADYVEGIAKAAGALRSLGIGKGERYAIISHNSVAYSQLIHAGYWLGAIPVPMNFRLAQAEIAQQLDDAECKLLIVEDRFLEWLDRYPLDGWRNRAACIDARGKPGDLPCFAEITKSAAAIEPNDPLEDDDAILLYTGATTGKGKGVRLTHRNIVSNALQLSKIMNVGADDLYLHVSPMFHSTDLKATVITMMGGAHAYLPEFSPTEVLAAIERYRVTIASLVPTMLIRILQNCDPGRYDLGSLRLISYGTSPMSAAWIRRVMTAFPGVALQQVYGLTESSPVLTILDENDHRRGLEGRTDLLAAAGRPLPGVDIRIVDRMGNALPIGEAGEIVVRGPQIAKGYHNRPDAISTSFANGWFYTGDIGRLSEDGYLFVLDRKKEMVVTGGENVYTQEVETVICEHPGVSEVAVVGIPDEQFGEALLAVVVPVSGHTLNSGQIIDHCRGRIGGYKIPRRIVFTDALPKSAMGKTLKSDVRRFFGANAQDTKSGPSEVTAL